MSEQTAVYLYIRLLQLKWTSQWYTYWHVYSQKLKTNTAFLKFGIGWFKKNLYMYVCVCVYITITAATINEKNE